MNLNQIHIGPFTEGYIRVASSIDPTTEKTIFDGSMEVFTRKHVAQQNNEGAELITAVPKLSAHELTTKLMSDIAVNKKAEKLVEIPIRMFFEKTANAISAKYQAYDSHGHPVCAGDGNNAMRVSSADDGKQITTEVECVGAEACAYANCGQATCRRQVSMTVQIKGQENPLSVFEVRTSSYNSYKALRGQLELIEKRFGGLRHVPLKLQIWQASNLASEFVAFDLLKLNLDASSEIEAMRAVKKDRSEELEIGLTNLNDATFEALKGKDLLTQHGDDFAVVSDFYRPLSSQESGRRAGSQSVASQVVSSRVGGSKNPMSAADMISRAVKGVAVNRTVEEEVPAP